MRAVVYHGPHDLRVSTVPDATIEDPGDVIVATTATSMCGSDLYLYQGEMPDLAVTGKTILGHEIVGEVVGVGSGVTRFSEGDRVTFPFSVSCGTCSMCTLGLTGHCSTSGKAIYGFRELAGSHAEFVRVPMADGHLRSVPDVVDDAAAVLLSCNLPAAMIVVDAADVQRDDVVAVVGAGPTGLLALQLLTDRLERPPFVLDRVPHRLDRAASLGGIPIDVETDHVSQIIGEATHGAGVDAVVEFAGRGDAFDLATTILRPGGVFAGGGVYRVETAHPTSLGLLFANDLQMRLNGLANVLPEIDRAVQAITERSVDADSVFSHRIGLDEVPVAAEAFSRRDDGFHKMLVTLGS
ncbi:MAG: alcohol dehydrogenase catalytic domain-containing protein [Actinomycetia bacterium]|nr:alcohol dehydrogenase catalytic domain-containing protein [Actinomycetes bacterium]